VAKRNFREAAGVPFGDNTPSNPQNNSLLELDAELYGKIAAVDAQVERLKAIDIFTIEPDPQQPRRAMPSAVRAHWNGDPRTIGDLFAVWWQLVQDERGKEFSLPAYLVEQDEITHSDRLDDPGPIEAALLEVIDLAVSIRRDGLANPITVVPLPTDKLMPERYRLETGERRWLAHHLLYQFFESVEERERWIKIQAREMKTVSVWRQAAENSARQNLNAIGKARQFAILLMDLWERDEKDPKTFKPMSAFGTERAYYAQAANLSLPYGKREMLLKIMGVKSAAELTRCRKLLTLPDEMWVRGDDQNLSQDVLLKIVDPRTQIDEALQNVPTWNDSGRQALNTASAKKNDPALRQGKRLFSSEKASSIRDQIRYLTGLRSGISEANQDTKEGLRYSIHDIRRFLDEVEHLLDKE
jgi:ParB-like chromosome segregation protein Spo0J